MFRALENTCDGACLRKCKLLKTCNYFRENPSSYLFDRVVNLSEIILPPSISPGHYFEFRISHLAKIMFNPETGSELFLNIYDGVYL